MFVGIIVATAAMLSLQSLWHGHIGRVTEYDDGVYFAAALEVARGILPYRAFDFLQPPLITVWLLPFAAVAAHTSQRLGFELARWFTDLVAVVDVALVGVLMRGRSLARMALAMSVTALSIGFLQASQTILIEPYLVLWCLLGLVALGRKPRGLLGGEILSGVCFGLAGATKVWAILPAAVVFVVVLSGDRRRAARFALATGASFVLVVAPFVVSDPVGALHQVLLAQAQRGFSGESLAGRLGSLSGLALLSPLSGPLGFVVGPIAALVALAALFLWRRGALAGGGSRPSELASIARWSALVVGLALLAAPEFYYHYGAFFSPFLGLALGTAPVPQWFPRRGVIPALAVLAVLAVGGDVQAMMSPPISGVRPSPVPLVRGASACVVSDQPAVLILVNSFTGARPGCPHVADWLGTERVLVHGTSGVRADAASPAFQDALSRWVAEARVVLLSSINGGVGPKVEAMLREGFTSRWRPGLGATLYRRRA